MKTLIIITCINTLAIVALILRAIFVDGLLRNIVTTMVSQQDSMRNLFDIQVNTTKAIGGLDESSDREVSKDH